MATYQELRTRSQQVRDEQNIGGNTALRVGQLLMDIVKYFYDTDMAASEYLEQHFAMVNDGTHLLNWQQSPIVILHTMGDDYDDGDFSALSQGENYYRAGFIMEANGQGGGINGETPKANVLYVNLANDTLYTWNGASFDAITSGGGGGISGDDIIKNAYYSNGNLVLIIETESGDKTVTIPVTFDASNYVPTSRTVNGKALNNNITLSQSDIPGLVAALAAKVGYSDDEWLQVKAGAIQATTAVQDTTTVNGKRLNNNIVIGMDDIPGLAQAISEAGDVKSVTINGTNHTPDSSGVIDLGTVITAHQDISGKQDTISDLATIRSGAAAGATALQPADVRAEAPATPDGTFTLNVGSNEYSINLNHTHENMAKLEIVDEEPSNPALDTIYAQVDDADTPTEIQSLWIAGLEFVGGGGVPDDEPKLTLPRSGVTIDFEGQSTVTLFVKGKNLASALSIAVTGDFTVTLNGSTVSSISSSDANNGVTLTLTQGSGFSGGTLSISSTEVDTRTLTVDDSESLSLLDGIKLTGTQWLQTDFVPTTATDIEMKLKFTANAITETRDETKIYFLSCYTLQGTNKQYAHAATTKGDQDYSQYAFTPIISASSAARVFVSKTDFVLDKSTYRHLHGGSLTFIAGEGGTSYTGTTPAVVAQVDPLTIGLYHTTGGVDQIFNKYDLTIYEFTVKENGETLRHYVPAMRLGTPGLYDTITGHFASSKTSTPVEVVTNS